MWSKPSAAGFLTYELQNHRCAGVPRKPESPRPGPKDGTPLYL